MGCNGLRERAPEFWGTNRGVEDWPEVEFEDTPAGPALRLTAALLDSLLSEAVGGIAAFAWVEPPMGSDLLDILSGGLPSGTLDAWLSWAAAVIAFRLALRALYFAGFEGSPLQGTPGKFLMGIKVVDDGGSPIGYARALGRWAAKFLSWFSFTGILRVFWEPRRRMLHDSVAGTEVVLRKPS